jgi:hypothetical protein
MRIPDKLLNSVNDGLEFKLIKEYNGYASYSIDINGFNKGRIQFKYKGFIGVGDDDINITGIYLHCINEKVGTKILKNICKYGKLVGAINVNIWHILEEKEKVFDEKGKKVKFSKKKRIKILKKIGKRNKREVFYDKDNDRVIYKL